jgi:YVTN family beta-propeller protein
MRSLFLALGIATLLPVALHAQSPSLQKLWETDTIIAVPESVLPDPAHHILYVSLIDGGPWDADGKGGVGRLSPDGKQYNGTWITGLNAPKGMGRFGNRLYVADLGDVVVIDIAKGQVIKKIPIPGESGLNDITVDNKGVVYVSDSKSGKVYRIAGDVPSLFMDNLPGANGLKASGSELYILARKQVLLADASGHLKVITDLPNGGDGVEMAGNGDLIVSEWIGHVYYVYPDGRKVLMLDRTKEKKNTADIWYDQSTKTLYVPGFNGKTITAYRLKP